MARLEDLNPGLQVAGIVTRQSVSVVGVQWRGTSAVELFRKRVDGRRGAQLLYSDHENRIELIATKWTWTFDANGTFSS